MTDRSWQDALQDRAHERFALKAAGPPPATVGICQRCWATQGRLHRVPSGRFLVWVCAACATKATDA